MTPRRREPLTFEGLPPLSPSRERHLSALSVDKRLATLKALRDVTAEIRETPSLTAYAADVSRLTRDAFGPGSYPLDRGRLASHVELVEWLEEIAGQIEKSLRPFLS